MTLQSVKLTSFRSFLFVCRWPQYQILPYACLFLTVGDENIDIKDEKKEFTVGVYDSV